MTPNRLPPDESADESAGDEKPFDAFLLSTPTYVGIVFAGPKPVPPVEPDSRISGLGDSSDPPERS